MTTSLILHRTTFTDNSTIGELRVDQEFFCHTLENTSRRKKISGVTAIPQGKYEIKIAPSPRYQRLMPRLLKVPNYEGILIHWGNYPRDTLGCILVGKFNPIRPDFISSSIVTFNRLFDLLTHKKGDIWISISGGSRFGREPLEKEETEEKEP